MDHVEHPLREPGLGEQLCRQGREHEGSFSEGLSTKVLPQAMASGYIHIGTIAGKLNGVIPATTPSGWRIVYVSTPVEPAPRNPLEEVGDVAGELHHFEASLHLAESIIDGLPMLRGGDWARSIFALATSSRKANMMF